MRSLAESVGANAEQVAAGLAAFRGLKRRLEELGTWRGVTVVDDYAHHPTEVRASLAALREQYLGRRLVCVFQPHQASRTARLLDEFASSLQNVDLLAVAEVFAAREPHGRPIATSDDLARRIRGDDAAILGEPAVNQLGSEANFANRGANVVSTNRQVDRAHGDCGRRD